jgi:hypothetical protein
MTRAALLAAIAALALVPAAAAAGPHQLYRFQHPAAANRAASTVFVGLAHKRFGGRWVVRSVSCAKGGIGRTYCAVVATRLGRTTAPYELTVLCADDEGHGCSAYIDSWTPHP